MQMKKLNDRMHSVFILFLLAFIFASGNPAVAQKHDHLLSYTDAVSKEKTVRSDAEWEIKRAQILSNMQLAMGALPQRNNLPPLNILFIDSAKETNYTRYTIRFTSAPNERVSAYLYVPVQTGIPKPLPALLALHPTGGLGKKIADGQGPLQNRAYAKEMADRGYLVIAPDYPGFGEQKDYDFGADRYQSGTMKSIFDNMRCVDLLLERADVDPKKIAVMGHSLGGHNAIFTGAFDPRIKAVVSSCGWTLMHDYFNGDSLAVQQHGGTLWPWAQEKYMPAIREKYQLDPDRVPFDFDEAIAAIAPRAFFSSSPLEDANFSVAGVRKGMARIAEVYTLLNVPGKLQVSYPACKHDFPPTVRWQAYEFIDKVLGYKTREAPHYSYLFNQQYFKRVAIFETQKQQKNIVMLGNSLTERGDWPDILDRDDVINHGIGSDITAGYINRIKLIFDLKPTVCFIEGGVNDLARKVPQHTIIANLAALVDTLRFKNIKPVLHTLTYVAGNYRYIDPKAFNIEIKKLNRAIRVLAKQKNVPLINLNKKIARGSMLKKKYAIADGIHYTDETYLLWKREIIKVLNEFKKVK